MASLALNVSANAFDLSTHPAVKAMTSPAHQRALFAEMIDWKVGEYQEFVVKLSFFSGTMTKEVTAEEGEGDEAAIWITQLISLAGQKQEVKTLIRRSDAKTLKVIVNGQEQPVDEEGGEVEVLEQRQEKVTVPAGTFDAIYVKARVKAQDQDQVVELWAAPGKVNMEGLAKMKTEAQGMEITIELKKFGSR